MNTRTEQVDVAIIGAGLTGAALAAALSQNGYSTAVIDRQQWPRFDPDNYDLRVSAFNRASQNFLTNIGAWHDIASRRAYPFTRVVACTGPGSSRVEFSAEDLGETHLGHMIENCVVVNALAGRLDTLPGATVVLGDATVSITAGEDRVTIDFESGRRLRCRLLVGADGPRSMVRNLCGITQNEGDYGQRCTVGTIWFDGDLDHTAWQKFLATGPLGFLPLARGACSLAWSAANEEADRLKAMDDDEFAAALESACDHRLGHIRAIGNRAAYPLRHAHARTYIGHRVVLIGDAAHVVHPLAGLGANLGLTDAAVLADVLTAAGPDRDPGQRIWLRKYERRRHGHNEVMLNVMDGFTRLFSNEDGFLKTLRDGGLAAARFSGPAKIWLARRASGLAGDLPPIMMSPTAVVERAK